jgi:hypothetical protein
VREPAADALLTLLKPELTALPRYALTHGADPSSISVMSSRVTAAVAALA